MITIDAEATERLRGYGHADGHPLQEAGRLSRATGMDVVRLPGAGLALGKTVHDGSWAGILRDGASLLDAAAAPAWRPARVDGVAGLGLVVDGAGGLRQAFGAMLRLPSPILDDGSVVEARVAGPDEAADALGAAAAPRP